MESESGVNFLNVAYFFRLIYNLLTGGGAIEVSGGSMSLWPAVIAFVSAVWLVVCLLGFLIAVAALMLLIHSSMRIAATKQEEAPRYATAHPHEAEVKRDHSRWNHVLSLIESHNESDWRQAIIEADIMLDDLLTQLGYAGQTVGEKLKAVDPSRFRTLDDAWEAHKVRNMIAHQGSSFELTDHIAYRTIQRYENVMTEHGEI